MSGTGDFSDYYDKFSVSLAGMQVLVAKPGKHYVVEFLCFPAQANMIVQLAFHVHVRILSTQSVRLCVVV